MYFCCKQIHILVSKCGTVVASHGSFPCSYRGSTARKVTRNQEVITKSPPAQYRNSRPTKLKTLIFSVSKHGTVVASDGSFLCSYRVRQGKYQAWQPEVSMDTKTNLASPVVSRRYRRHQYIPQTKSRTSLLSSL